MPTGKHMAARAALWAVVAARLVCAPVSFAGGAVPDQGPPARVVSMNLCTDLLAMMLAAPEQLISVSHLSRDWRVSPMVDEAAAYEINHGFAEEIYDLRPGLVLAADWSNPATLRMLERLDVPVAQFASAETFDDVRDRIAQMGALLHREAQADTMIARFDEDLAWIRAQPTTEPRAVFFHANGLTSGEDGLSGQILRAAGFRNAAAEAGYRSLDRLPLEVLALMEPDIIINSQRYPGASRSEQIMTHPVLRALGDPAQRAATTDHDWVCGTPLVLRAVRDLIKVRAALEAGQ